MEYPVKRICCVCKEDLGPADWKSDRPDIVTHSYCDACAAAELRKIKES